MQSQDATPDPAENASQDQRRAERRDDVSQERSSAAEQTRNPPASTDLTGPGGDPAEGKP